MNNTLTIKLLRVYKKEHIPEFDMGFNKVDEITKEVLYQLKAQKLAEKGFIRLAKKKKVDWDMPPKFAGTPLSEYVKEIKE